VRSTRATVVALGSAQTLAWASSFYLPAVLAAPMARELGLGTPTVFAAFSGALGLAALVGPATGRWIDRHGGRGLLMATNGLFALGLAALGAAEGPIGLVMAWALLGVAMGAGLYDAAFATLVRLYGIASRDPITGITLIAGFASTLGWPLSAWMSAHWGWRGACLGWAALHLVAALPLNALLPRAPARPAAGSAGRAQGPASTTLATASVGDVAAPSTSDATPVAPSTPPAPRAAPVPPIGPAVRRDASRRGAILLLAFVFATTRFVSTAIGAHGPALLVALGSTLAAAVAAGALIGPAQVGGRLLEFGLLRRVHPLLSARLATLGHPLGALALLTLGMPAAAPFALLHGAGNGILTIAKGTLPLVLFGAGGYGARQGWLSMPALALQALAPWLFGLLVERSAAGALMLSTGLSLAALLALLVLRAPRP
jgi:MFS family permease